ncbi:hypothetical protein FNV43_RR04109 [Rhamnella rubrinervis]|uniref:Aspartate racemase n=1 Tax=Rhamnella rubrinervis TaxID=2594499 RepID=A0A8K0MPX7_9ROSA|nr:hypothetical protein FNV43_RR04109 [Rhamnella rubrinervis]
MFDGSMAMSFYKPTSPLILGAVNKKITRYRTRSNLSVTVQVSSELIQTDEGGTSPEPNKIFPSGLSPTRSQTPNHLLSQPNTIGIIGGVSTFSTLIFLEKLVRWSTKCGGCPPFVVCNDPASYLEVSLLSSFPSLDRKIAEIRSNTTGNVLIVENLRNKRAFLEHSGARCIVMPCHISHVWHSEISEGCSLPFLHVGECVARELREAKLKPVEVGSNVKIGVLATNPTLMTGVYQDKLENQGFEVVFPDKATIEHVINPAMEALSNRDIKGSRNLLKIAVQILLVRAVNTVILASHEMQGLIPHNDPLLKKCIDPMDALARSTIQWATSRENET